MRVADTATPEAVLTQLILAALLTLVAKAGEVTAITATACNRMMHGLHDGEAMEDVEPDEAGRAHVRQRHVEEVLQANWTVHVETGPGRGRFVVAERGLLEHGLGQGEQVFEIDFEFRDDEQALVLVAYLCKDILKKEKIEKINKSYFEI